MQSRTEETAVPRDGGQSGPGPLLPDGLVDAYPMSELQVGMVYEMERDPGRLPYHNVHSLRIPGSFDERCFRTAVARTAARHDVLRTSFALAGFSEPMQLVYETAEIPVAVTDLRAVPESAARETLAGYLRAERRTAFDLSVPPLCRMGVHVLSDDAFQWTVTEHHAILDGWSLASLVSEITGLYRRLLAGEDPVPAPPVSAYRDFIAAEREALESPESREYWHRTLAELPDSRLPRWPGDRPVLPAAAAPAPGERHRHDGSEGHGSLVSPLPGPLLSRIRELARQCRVPVKAVLLAAHMKVMSLVTGERDVVAGLTVNGRLEEADGAEVCGLFVNTVPFRMKLPDGTWRDLIHAVVGAENALLPHRRYPMAALQRELGGSPLFETNFVYTDFRQLAEAGGTGGDSAEDAADDAGEVSRTHFPLVVAFGREPGTGAVCLEMEYDARAFPAVQLAVLRDHYLRVLEAMTADPDAGHRWAELLGAQQRGLLEEWNDTAAEVPSLPVHRMVERRAAAAPDAEAVVSEGVRLSYGELNARANRLARRLRGLGVGPDTPVGVCAGRSVEMVLAWLAVLKAGGMYVPLDPGFPSSRLEYMLRQTGAALVLAGPDAAGGVPAGPWQVLALEENLWAGDAGDAGDPAGAENLPGGAGPDNGCYVIFTSGSTGRPKGVVTRHRNVTELLHGGDSMTVLPGDTVLQIAPASFDVSTFEVWAPLTGGARLVLAPAVRYGPAEVAAWVAGSGTTVLHATASLFALLVDQEPQTFDGLRRVLTGSETVSPGHTARILRRCPDLEVVNCWGPTETTTFSVCGVFRNGELPEGPLPLGLPLANTEVWVLDEAGLPVPVGSPGELCVSGPCLARGYLGRPALTAERFLPHPHRPGERLYRTGDRGRWSVDGRVEFLGRMDHMVKIRGYRVELGEVESVLHDHPGLREAVVVFRQDPRSGPELVAHLVPGPQAPATGELRTWLGTRLPDYMVPRRWVFHDALPLTRNGKVDRRALPEPGDIRPELAQEYVPPQGRTEEFLASVWCRVLGVDRVGRHDNFFDLGGDSMRSIQVIGLTREAGLSLGVQDLLGAPTLAGLASAAAPGTPGGAPAAEEGRTGPFSLVAEADRPLLPDGLEDAYPMAELQIGMVYEMERDRARNPYHNVESLRLSGRFDEACFREAVARVVARHPVLRTSFDLARYSEPMQLVARTAELPCTVADLRGLSAEQQQDTLRAHLADQQAARFDLGVAPLCRMGVHVLSDDAFQWTVTEHHAILDGWSMVSTVSEITGLYHRLLAGEDPATEPLRSHYRDYIAAERAALESPESREFWRDRLAGAPDARLPGPWPPAPDASPAGDTVAGERHLRHEAAGHGILTTPLPPELRHRLEKFAGGAAVPLKAAVLTAHLKAISLLTGSPDVLIGITANGRLEEPDGAEARGLFLNTVPLRLRLPEGSWQDLARAVHRAELDLLPHRRYPLSALQRAHGRGAPLFETNFTYNNFHRVLRLAESGTLGPPPAGPETPGVARTNFPLDVTISHRAGGGLLLEIDYALDGLTADQVTRLRDWHLRALHAMAGDGTAHHRAVSLLGTAERRQLNSWQGTSSPAREMPVHELFRRAAARWPDAVAVESGAGRLSFAEL
ncbi:non-ribosomal peptide synthetase, partial [Streptomyces aidingensis]|uniref:non-ribosomal peptide synthetase n=1 Tax=Streptomyces aidingensis TaxID=910347 RepID=UPI00111502ED